MSYFAYLKNLASVFVMLIAVPATLGAWEMEVTLTPDVELCRQESWKTVLLHHGAKLAQTKNGSRERQKSPEYCQLSFVGGVRNGRSYGGGAGQGFKLKCGTAVFF